MGLKKKHININQGAESTICFFKSQIIMAQYNKNHMIQTLNIESENEINS